MNTTNSEQGLSAVMGDQHTETENAQANAIVEPEEVARNVEGLPSDALAEAKRLEDEGKVQTTRNASRIEESEDSAENGPAPAVSEHQPKLKVPGCCATCNGERVICPCPECRPDSLLPRKYIIRSIRCSWCYLRCPTCVDKNRGADTLLDAEIFMKLGRGGPFQMIKMRERYMEIKAAVLKIFPCGKTSRLDEEIEYLTEEIDCYLGNKETKDNRCWMCSDSRRVCPGCTRGKIPRELFMGCGVAVRCPVCMDYESAFDDINFYLRHYDDDSSDEDKTAERRARRRTVKKAIVAKYPHADVSQL
jgi:hypothetical protein